MDEALDELDEALDEVDEDSQKETAVVLLQKYMRGKAADKETSQKAFRYLLSKGFDYEVAKAAISTLVDVEEWER